MSYLPRFPKLGAMLAIAFGLTSQTHLAARENDPDRQVLAFAYPEGATRNVTFQGTSRLSFARGDAAVERNNGVSEVEVHLDGLKPAAAYGGQYHTYVLWIVSPDGRVENAGELLLEGGRSALSFTTPLETFGMLVTAEPHFLATLPSPFVVLENVGPAANAGPLTVSTVSFQGFDGSYRFDRETLSADAEIAVNVDGLGSARTALQLAEAAGAAKFASRELAKAKAALSEAEERFSSEAGRNDARMLARDAIRLAVEAENQARERAFAGALAREREASAERLSALESSMERAASESERNRLEAERNALDAELEAKARDEAEREAAEAARRAAEAERRAHAEVKDRIAAENAKLAAEQAKLAAEQAKGEAERRRIEAEREAADARLARENARAELGEAMARFAAVRENARGLIVSLPNILFATNQAALTPAGREALAKISGVLQIAQGYTLSIEGHTDDVGSKEHNLELSQRRAASVRDYLVEQGVPADSVSARGFGESQPLASNETAAGRQENRRVEIVVNESPEFGTRPTSN